MSFARLGGRAADAHGGRPIVLFNGNCVTGKRQWIGEFFLIVLGVLAALAVDDFRESRRDAALERYMIAGIRDDITRDTADVGAALRAAEGRAAAADDILLKARDPAGGQVAPMDLQLDRQLAAVRKTFPVNSMTVAEALVRIADQRRIDLSTPTFSEAIARGSLDRIRDLQLRTKVAGYYFNAGRYMRVDERSEANSMHFREILAAKGVAPGDNDEAILAGLISDASIRAELRNVREFALRQRSQQSEFLAAAVEVLRDVNSRLK